MKFFSCLFYFMAVFSFLGIFANYSKRHEHGDKKVIMVIAPVFFCVLFACLGWAIWPDDKTSKVIEPQFAKNPVSDSARKANAQLQSDSIKFEQRSNLIKSSFSPWDGSHRGLVTYLKERLNDADSFEHVSTNYWDMGTYLIVNMKYRAKNPYGAYMLGFIKAKVDLSGNVLKIIQSD